MGLSFTIVAGPHECSCSQVWVTWDSWPLMFRKYFSCLKSCWEWQRKLNKSLHFQGQSWNWNKACGVCIEQEKSGGWKTAAFLSARCAQRNQDTTPSYTSKGTILSKNIIWHTVISDKLCVLITAPIKLFYMRLLYLYHYFPNERHNQKSHLWSVSHCKGFNNTNMVNAEISKVMGERTTFNTRSRNLIKIYATLYEIWGFNMVVSIKIASFQDVTNNVWWVGTDIFKIFSTSIFTLSPWG
jgi:hypothetical protein